MKGILQDLGRDKIKGLCEDMGQPAYRADQLFAGLTKGKAISQITTLPKEFKEKLMELYEDEPLKIIKTMTSKDGTEKYLYELSDGNVIEGVFMSYKYGNTLCVSTQVGCRMGCKFCASTLGGLTRNLTAGEILLQVLVVNALHGGDEKNRKITNIVLMGSGEPLDNYEEVLTFLHHVCREGLFISPRNISLSTCGIVPNILRLCKEGYPLNLTISLHAVTDDERKKIMPVANRYKIADIMKACDEYFLSTGRRYIFEYSLIRGENCDLPHAQALIKLLKGKPCHVNLIRLNEVKERKLLKADKEEEDAFFNSLQAGGISCTVRRSLGSDIAGACGQLRAGFLSGKEN